MAMLVGAAVKRRMADGAGRHDVCRKSLSSGYFERSSQPLTALLFLLPLLAIYEVGTWYLATDHARKIEQRVIAFNLLRDFLGLFGATGRYLPPLAVVGVLLAWHVARRDPWVVHWGTVAVMVIESLLLGLPVLALGICLRRFLLPLVAGAHPGSEVVLSIGAGIYEELMFRLLGFTVLNIVLIDLLAMRKVLGYIAIVSISSVLFSLYHYLGAESFNWETFVFRTMAGAYFGVVFLIRGFGITAGSHAAYDLIRFGLVLRGGP